MANESDCELVVLKGPKTKLQITEDVSTKTNSDENNVLEDTTSFIDTKGQDELKKASKRSRESDEESSITSDDDIMSKKRVKKNSEELESFRPKKVLSVAVRKRRKVARTIREKQISALDSDSENDSDSVCSDLEAQKVLAVGIKSDLHNKCDDNATSIILSDVDDNIVANSCGVDVKKMYSKTDRKKLTRKHYKAYEKNEDSTSAYNSDSQDEVCKTRNVNSGETGMLELENGTRKTLEKSNSKSELDEDGNDKSEVAPDTNTNIKRVKCNEKKISTCDRTSNNSKQLGKTCSVDSSFSEKYPSCTTFSDKVDHRKPQENLPLTKVDDVKFSNSSKSGKKVSCISSESNSEDNSSDETSEKESNISVLRETVDKNIDVKKYLKTSKSPSEKSSGDEVPLKTTLSSSPKIGWMKVESKLKGTSSRSLHKDCHSDENDQMVSKTLEKQGEEKVVRMKEVKICQDFSDYSSDRNRPFKKTKSSKSSEVEIKSQLPTKSFVSVNVDSGSNDDDRPVDHTGYSAVAKLKVKSKIEKHSTSNPSSSQEENHSEGEQPLKKTKSSNKTRSISDYESSDDSLLKEKQKEKTSKNRVITKTSADNSDDVDDQHFENKQFVAHKGDTANVLKNRKSKSKQSVSCQRPEFCVSDEETRISKSHKIKIQKSKKKGVESSYDVCLKGYGKSKTTFSEKHQNTSSENESVYEKPIKKKQADHKNKISRKEKDVENEKSDENSLKNKKLPCNKKASSSESDSDNYCKSSKKSTVKRNQSSSDNSSDSDKPLQDTVSSLKKVASGISKQHVTLSFANKHKHIKRGRISRETLSKSKNSENSSASSCDASDSDEQHGKTPKSGKDPEVSLVSKTCHEKLLKSSCFPSDSESVKKRPIKMLKEKESTLLKKDISDSESSGEKNSGSEDKKPDAIKSVKREDLSSDSSNSNKLLSSKVKHEISDSTDMSDSEGNKKVSEYKKKMSKTCEGVSGKKPPTSSFDCETDIKSKSDVNRKKSKGPSKMEIRINNYKKYIRAAGIRVNTRINSPFWEGCKSDKQICDRLAKCLEDHGVKGRPSIQKCKVVRKKLEKKREVEELDLRNIIEDDGNTSRYRCRSSRRDSCENKNVILEKNAVETASEIKQRFSRIKDLIDSDSSSN